MERLLEQQAFSATLHSFDGVGLLPVTPAAASELARRLAAIPPWSVMNYPAQAMEDYLTRPDPAARRFSIMREGSLAGVAAIRWPWLRGPYLEMLGLIPEFQGQGLGAAALDWMERQASLAEARWLWLLASSFNVRAIAFYERRGFERTALLDDLVADGFTEILMRKRSMARRP
jgi:ribosomal protein S18 acetylase RimI-like enzyme